MVRLFEDGAGTLLKYEAKADVGGKLAQLGGRLIESTARKLAGEFFQNFSAIVGARRRNSSGAPSQGGLVPQALAPVVWPVTMMLP